MARIQFEKAFVLVIQIASPGVLPQVLISWTVEAMHRGEDKAVFTVERSLSRDFSQYEVVDVSGNIAGVN